MNKKLQVWLPLLFSLVMIVGMMIGYKLNTSAPAKTSFFSSNKTGTLQEAIDLIRMKYVDTLSVTALQSKAISEMINELDPHSVYIPPAELKESNEDLAGSFEGIGIEFQVFDDTLNVLYVVPDGPSEKAGLLTGDKILSVNDSTLVGRTKDIPKLIRGDSGSKAILKIKRNNEQKIISVIRGAIPVSSVEAAFMINSTIGFIKLNKFTQNSYEEFMQAMEKLLQSGMQQLVIDLRGNGGGFMQEAVEMADEFLDGDKLIVYTSGANSKKKEYTCKRPGLFEKGKLTILLDELSASASEVLAGALQDWCRAKIVGRRSFGKGLVQEQYGLSDGGALRLTVARYYTPVGRSIQKSYEQGRKIYMDDIWQRYYSGEMTVADSNKINKDKALQTVCGATVYGGGGIMPDLFVAIDTSLLSKKIGAIVGAEFFSKYLHQYYLLHRAELQQYKSPTALAAGFSNRHKLLEGFLQHSSTPKKLTDKEKQSVENYLLAYLARYQWRHNGLYEILYKNDPAIKKALE